MSNREIHLAEDTIASAELENLADWIKTNPRLTKGPLCKNFEEEFAHYLGSKYAVYVNSGSSANLLMAWAFLEGGYLRNKKIIAPAVSWCTTVTPFMQFGFKVSLCDCDKNDLGINVQHFEELCDRERPASAILVHVLGHACQMEKILEICQKYNVILLEDTCEALGTTIAGGKKLGSIGSAGSFSFYYGHHISTIEGGMVVTNDQKLYNLMLSIRSHGWARDIEKPYHDLWTTQYGIDEIRDLYTFYYPGFNLRSTDLNAFLGLSQIKKIDKYSKIRSHNYHLYSKFLSDYWTQTSQSEFLSSFSYGVLVENRFETYKYLSRNGIECRPLICGNIGRHPFWLKQYPAVLLPMADIVHDYGLYLPNHANLVADDIAYICDKFKKIAKPKICNTPSRLPQ
jgi:CDP-6-deoxy-D-xylo-4-hexulose-3-dehydrase